MPKRSYKGDKRRRELAKKRKREDKLTRKQTVKDVDEFEAWQDADTRKDD